MSVHTFARRLAVATLALAAAVTGTVGATAATSSAAESTAGSSARATTYAPSFRAASFNILGANHTIDNGRWATYEPRMHQTIELIDDLGLDIVGVQEFQGKQIEMFKQETGRTWGMYPGMEEGRGPGQNSIIWRRSEWTVVAKRLYEIPYFYGTMTKQPYVKLRNDDGVVVWVINTHNPADSHGDASAYRNQANETITALARKLEGRGFPVILTGDFNSATTAFCDVTSKSRLVASQGGGGWVDGRCTPPTTRGIDWMFISRQVRASGYQALYDSTVSAISDHPVVFADLQFPVSSSS